MAQTLNCDLLSLDKVEHYWDMIEAELNRIQHLWIDRYTIDFFYTMCTTGAFQVWAAGDEKQIRTVLFTTFSDYPAGRHLSIVIAFGTDFVKLAETIRATLECFAVRAECKMIEAVARPGFGRLFGIKPMREAFDFRVQGGVH